MPGKPEVKPHVKKHLESRNVDHTQVPDEVLVVLNEFSESELKTMGKLGATMEETKVDVSMRAAMVH
jgi:hypothetical protein